MQVQQRLVARICSRCLRTLIISTRTTIRCIMSLDKPNRIVSVKKTSCNMSVCKLKTAHPGCAQWAAAWPGSRRCARSSPAARRSRRCRRRLWTRCALSPHRPGGGAAVVAVGAAQAASLAGRRPYPCPAAGPLGCPAGGTSTSRSEKTYCDRAFSMKLSGSGLHNVLPFQQAVGAETCDKHNINIATGLHPATKRTCCAFCRRCMAWRRCAGPAPLPPDPPPKSGAMASRLPVLPSAPAGTPGEGKWSATPGDPA